MGFSTNELKGWQYLYLIGLCIFVIGIGLLGMAMSEMIVSRIYAKECSIQPKIPLFLLILGIVNLFDGVLLIMTLFFSCPRATDDAERKGLKITVFLNLHILITLFQLIWVVIGSVWVFSICHVVVYDAATGSSNYCHKTLYQFTFSMIIFSYILVIAHICAIVNTCCNLKRIYQLVAS